MTPTARRLATSATLLLVGIGLWWAFGGTGEHAEPSAPEITTENTGKPDADLAGATLPGAATQSPDRTEGAAEPSRLRKTGAGELQPDQPFVRVRYRESGDPVAHATLYLMDQGRYDAARWRELREESPSRAKTPEGIAREMALAFGAVLETDLEGRAAIPELQGPSEFNCWHGDKRGLLLLIPEAFAKGMREGEPVWTLRPDRVEYPLWLDTPKSLDVRLLDAGNRPIARAKLELRFGKRGHERMRLSTNAEGRCTFPGLQRAERESTLRPWILQPVVIGGSPVQRELRPEALPEEELVLRLPAIGRIQIECRAHRRHRAQATAQLLLETLSRPDVPPVELTVREFERLQLVRLGQRFRLSGTLLSGEAVEPAGLRWARTQWPDPVRDRATTRRRRPSADRQALRPQRPARNREDPLVRARGTRRPVGAAATSARRQSRPLPDRGAARPARSDAFDRIRARTGGDDTAASTTAPPTRRVSPNDAQGTRPTHPAVPARARGRPRTHEVWRPSLRRRPGPRHQRARLRARSTPSRSPRPGPSGDLDGSFVVHADTPKDFVELEVRLDSSAARVEPVRCLPGTTDLLLLGEALGRIQLNFVEAHPGAQWLMARLIPSGQQAGPWTRVRSPRYVRFTGLPKGSYTLELRPIGAIQPLRSLPGLDLDEGGQVHDRRLEADTTAELLRRRVLLVQHEGRPWKGRVQLSLRAKGRRPWDTISLQGPMLHVFHGPEDVELRVRAKDCKELQLPSLRSAQHAPARKPLKRVPIAASTTRPRRRPCRSAAIVFAEPR